MPVANAGRRVFSTPQSSLGTSNSPQNSNCGRLKPALSFAINMKSFALTQERHTNPWKPWSLAKKESMKYSNLPSYDTENAIAKYSTDNITKSIHLQSGNSKGRSRFQRWIPWVMVIIFLEIINILVFMSIRRGCELDIGTSNLNTRKKHLILIPSLLLDTQSIIRIELIASLNSRQASPV